MAVIYTPQQKKNLIIRLILFILVLVCFGVFIAIAVSSFRAKEGLKEIKADYSTAVGNPDDYKLYYYLEKNDKFTIAQMEKEVATIYSNAVDEIFPLLDSTNEYENIKNIYYLNMHINEVIEINPILYGILNDMYLKKSDFLYLGTVYQLWNNLIYSNNTEYIKQNDPFYNKEQEKTLNEFINTYKDNIFLEFYDNNQIKINVNSNFVTASGFEVTSYIDLGIFKTAYIMQYIKNKFISSGLTNGILVNDLGFSVDFGSEIKDKFNINVLYNNLNKPTSILNLDVKSNYSYINIYNFNALNNHSYEIETSDGTLNRNLFINPNTGYSLNPEMTLIVYSNKDIVDVLFDCYDKLLLNNCDSKYINITKDKKILTNDIDFTNDYYEVKYE